MEYIKKLVSTTNIGKRASLNFIKKHFYSLENEGDEVVGELSNFHVNTSFKVVHVTGTAGKGSTSTMIAKGLEEAGFKVGLFTSPHIFRVNERIQINSSQIDSIKLENLLNKYYTMYSNITFSEILVLVAIEYFSQENVDYAVFEVFVGGELDITNIFNSCATIITSIGLDHQQLLGNSYEEILNQKLGIIRRNVPLFTRIEHSIIFSKTHKIGALYKKVTRIENTNLNGEFQKENSGIAFEVLTYLGVSKETIKKALNSIKNRGRLEFVKDNILIDTAHNELALRRILTYLQNFSKDTNYTKRTLIFALSNNKDLNDFSFFMDFFDSIILTKSSIFKAKDLSNCIHSLNDDLQDKISLAQSQKEIFQKIIQRSSNEVHKTDKLNNELFVVTGSVFLVADFLEFYDFYHVEK